jgi:uncharacterized protein (TIGR03435 family)
MIFIFECGLAFGQAQEKLAFEVASVRPAAPPAGNGPDIYRQRGGPGTNDPGQISYTNIPLRQLTMIAYGLTQPFRMTAPAWLDSQKFDIVAKLNPSSTRDDLCAMLRNLLAERFAMRVHHEIQELPIYELVVTKGGSKLKEPETAAAPPPAPPVPREPGEVGVVRGSRDRDGLPQLAAGGTGMMTIGIKGGTRYSARQQPISALTRLLESPLGRPVVDKTGLNGKYDFNLDFMRDERTSANMVTITGGGTPPPPPENPPDLGFPDLFTALQQELGLKLEDKKGPVDVLVVDRAERVPTEN